MAIRRLLEFLLIAWAALALYYNVPWRWLGVLLAAAFVGFGVLALWLTRRAPRRGRWAFAAAFVIVAVWFACIRPSHDRRWRPDVAVVPRAIVDGDRVRITGFRNFTYRAHDDFTPRYETRDFDLSRVASVDLLISHFQAGPMAHTFVSFNFDDGTPPLCISIEVRPEAGEEFAPLASLFKQFELIYVVGDERDLIGVRAAHRDEEVYLYPIRAEPEAVRRLLRVYLARINELADRPEFYHLLKNNCAVNIARYANAAGRQPDFDARLLFSAFADRYLYEAGWVDTTLPLAELRRRCNITATARAALNEPDFSNRIRAGQSATMTSVSAPSPRDKAGTSP